MTGPSSRHPDDFDNNGLLKVPVLFWAALTVLARAWLLTGLMVMTVSSGNVQPGFLWPDLRFLIVALVAGLPGISMIFIYPLRGRWPGLSRANYVLILIALFVLGITDLVGLMTVSPAWDTGWVFICLDVACVVILWPDQWLRMVFFDQTSGGLSSTKVDT